MQTVTIAELRQKIAMFEIEYERDGVYGYDSLSHYIAARIADFYPDGVRAIEE